jgi:NAD(P)-dependent dehydrogenase (short-subunit alcohol dehydrogenase family)
MGRLDGRGALITGGGTGIGKAIAEQLIGEGAKVVVAGRRKEPLDVLEQQFGDCARSFVCDVAKRGDPAKAVAFAIEQLGRLDVLVNNAGLFIRKPLAETSDEDISAMLETNIRGVLSLSREALPYLSRAKGSIINVSSAAGIYAKPHLSAYGASKAGVHQLTRILAVELGPMGIRVNAVAPGLTRTEMTAPIFEDPKRLEPMIANTALRREGEPEDVARIVLFLATDEAAWVTGQTIAASGGLFL